MTLIGADFASACVLISFGVIIGTASPLMVAPHEHAEPEMSHGMHGG